VDDLSESLALAFRVLQPVRSQRSALPVRVHVLAGDRPGQPPRSDRGHLVLDAFTPYLQDGTIAKQPLGIGRALRSGVIDQFRAAVGVSSTPIIPATPPAANVRPAGASDPRVSPSVRHGRSDGCADLEFPDASAAG